jgi:hypothetical protein
LPANAWSTATKEENSMPPLKIVLADGSLAGHEVLFLELLWSTGDVRQDQLRISSFFQRMRDYNLDEQCVILFFGKDNLAQDFDIAEVLGRSRAETMESIKNADFLFNSCGGVKQPLLGMFRNRVLIDLDPGHLQVSALTADLDFDQHQIFFSVGKKLHDCDCPVPTFGVKWNTFFPFIYLPMWSVMPDPGPTAPFSSITHWTWGKEQYFQNRLISTSKRDAYLKYLELPLHCNRSFQLAANILPTDNTGDRELLTRHSWQIIEPWRVAATPDSYQAYITKCRAEICCPKPIFCELKTGWFSDRSACFLASGRPVLIEDTGLGEYLPTGEGLLVFNNMNEAAAGVAEIDTNYAHHMIAARRLAIEYLDSRRVLRDMLKTCVQKSF